MYRFLTWHGSVGAHPDPGKFHIVRGQKALWNGRYGASPHAEHAGPQDNLRADRFGSLMPDQYPQSCPHR